MSNFEKQFGSEYKFLDENKYLGDNIHLLVYGGSKAYGTNIPTSDTDIRGVATRRVEDILSGQDFGIVTNEATDTVIYSLDKFMSMISQCNPNMIEILFVRDEDILYIDDIGRMLRDNREIFLSNKCIGTFSGYADQQLYRLKQKTLSALSEEEYNAHISKVIKGMDKHLEMSYGIKPFIDIKYDENGLYADIKPAACPVSVLSDLVNELNLVIKAYQKKSDRNEKALAHNKINKHAMHLIRLYRMGIELMTTGTVCTYRYEDHSLLMDIRTGKYSTDDGQMNEEFFKLVEIESRKFDAAKKNSVLPNKPDEEAIKRLQVDINKAVVSEAISRDLDDSREM